MSLTPVSPDRLATVVTTLEMRGRSTLEVPSDGDLSLVDWPLPSPARYRALFRRVGAPWLWYSRLAMDDLRLMAITHDPEVAVLAAVDRHRDQVGLVELDFRRAGECELSYFALIPELAGRGHGRWMMRRALARAWRPGVGRIWVHTCTLDHPSALGFYRAQGFVAIARTLETFPDPRVLGLLPADAAPQVPLLASAR